MCSDDDDDEEEDEDEDVKKEKVALEKDLKLKIIELTEKFATKVEQAPAPKKAVEDILEERRKRMEGWTRMNGLWMRPVSLAGDY